MKKFYVYSLASLLWFAPGCGTTQMQKEPPSSITVEEDSNIPSQFKRKSAKELRKEERRRQKISTFFYSR